MALIFLTNNPRCVTAFVTMTTCYHMTYFAVLNVIWQLVCVWLSVKSLVPDTGDVGC